MIRGSDISPFHLQEAYGGWVRAFWNCGGKLTQIMAVLRHRGRIGAGPIELEPCEGAGAASTNGANERRKQAAR